MRALDLADVFHSSHMLLHTCSNDVVVRYSVGFLPIEAAVLSRPPLGHYPSNAGALLKTTSARYSPCPSPRRTRLSTWLQGPPIDTILLHYLWARSLNLSKQIQLLDISFQIPQIQNVWSWTYLPCSLKLLPQIKAPPILCNQHHPFSPTSIIKLL